MNPILPLFSHLSSSSHPALTSYSDADRIELSGGVLARWVYKIAGTLLDDLLLDADSRLGVLLPAHWRGIVWRAGALVAGVPQVALPPEASEDDLAGLDALVTDDEETMSRAVAAGVVDVLAQPLPSLALSWPGDLPEGVQDASGIVMGQPDALLAQPADASGATRPFEGSPLTLSDLATPLPGVAELARVAWRCRGGQDDLVTALRVWAAGGSALMSTGPLTPELLAMEGASPLPD